MVVGEAPSGAPQAVRTKAVTTDATYVAVTPRPLTPRCVCNLPPGLPATIPWHVSQAEQSSRCRRSARTGGTPSPTEAVADGARRRSSRRSAQPPCDEGNGGFDERFVGHFRLEDSKQPDPPKENLDDSGRLYPVLQLTEAEVVSFSRNELGQGNCGFVVDPGEFPPEPPGSGRHRARTPGRGVRSC